MSGFVCFFLSPLPAQGNRVRLTSFMDGPLMVLKMITNVTILQILTAVSIIWIVWDAIKYLRLYYSDSSFDNKYIDHITMKRWKKKKYHQLTPLRNWEYQYGYKTPVSKKVGTFFFGKFSPIP